MFGQDPEQMEQRISEWAQQFEQKAQRYQEMSQEVEKISVTESSRDGAVRVTVSANGNISDLTLNDRIRQYSPSQLSQAILTCMQRAQAQLAERIQETMKSTVGGDDPAVQHVVSGFQQRFPSPSDDGPAAPDGTRPPGSRRDRRQ